MTIDYKVLNLINPEYGNSVYPLAVSSLQVGFYTVIKSYGISTGDTVLCDPVFPYAALAVLHAGAKPVFPLLDGDIVPSVEAWQDAWQSNIRAVIGTVAFGYNSLTKNISPSSSNCPVILDCAFVPFSINFKYPKDADIIGYSFSTGKPLSCGEGGLILFNNPQLRENALRWSRFGLGDYPYETQWIPGLNFCMSPALLPVLKKSRARLFKIRQCLIDSWEQIKSQLLFYEYGKYYGDNFGWFNAFLIDRDIDFHHFPHIVEASGINWKRCKLKSSATMLVPNVPVRKRKAAESIARRLVWYRPVISEPWEKPNELPETL